MNRIWILLAMLPSVACGPDVFASHPDDAAFSSEVFYVCGRWRPAPPTAEWGLFDLDLPGGESAVRPRPAELRRIYEANGLVVHEFNLPMVRAVLRSESAVLFGRNSQVRGVTEPANYRVEVNVDFRFHTGYADSARHAALLDSLGGEVHRIYWWSWGGSTWEVTVPDSVIPHIRGQDDVRWVARPAVGCVAG